MTFTKRETKKDIERYKLSDDDKVFALGYRDGVSDLLSSLESIKFDIIVEEPHETFSKMKEEIIDEVVARLSESAVDNYYFTLEALEQDHLEAEDGFDEEGDDKEESIPF